MKKLVSFIVFLAVNLSVAAATSAISGINLEYTCPTFLAIGMIVGTVAPKLSMLTVPTPGTYDCSDLVKIIARASAYGADANVMRDYVANTGVISYVKQFVQTATLSPLQDPNKDYTLRLVVPQSCEIDGDDCDDECTVDGTELSSGCFDFNIDFCKKAEFKVPTKLFRSNELNFEDFQAKGLLKAQKRVDELFAQYVMTQLDANAGNNPLAGGSYTQVGNETQVPAALFTPEIMAYFAQIANYNHYSSASVLSGGNLWRQSILAAAYAANANGAGAANALGLLPISFDQHNIDGYLGDKATYLVARGAFAIETKNWYSPTPMEIKGNNVWQLQFSLPSPNIPGVNHDVIYTVTCENNEFYHNWRVTINGGAWLMPTGCDETDTGIIKFVCA